MRRGFQHVAHFHWKPDQIQHRPCRTFGQVGVVFKPGDVDRDRGKCGSDALGIPGRVGQGAKASAETRKIGAQVDRTQQVPVDTGQPAVAVAQGVEEFNRHLGAEAVAQLAHDFARQRDRGGRIAFDLPAAKTSVTGHGAGEGFSRQHYCMGIRKIGQKAPERAAKHQPSPPIAVLAIDPRMCARHPEIRFAVIGKPRFKRGAVLLEEVLQARRACLVKTGMNDDAGHSAMPSGMSTTIRPAARSTVGTTARVNGSKTEALRPGPYTSSRSPAPWFSTARTCPRTVAARVDDIQTDQVGMVELVIRQAGQFVAVGKKADAAQGVGLLPCS